MLLERLGEGGGLKGALVSIDAIATDPDIARAITGQRADYSLAVKANQPSLRPDVEAAFAEAEGRLEAHACLDKGYCRIEERRITVLREVDWLRGDCRFPGEPRRPGAACLLRAVTRIEAKEATRTGTRYFNLLPRSLGCRRRRGDPRPLGDPEPPARALDVTFADDQSCLRKGHGARNMAAVHHFAFNLVRAAQDKRSIKPRRKIAGWDPNYLDAILASRPG